MDLEQAKDLLNKASLESTTSYNWPTGPAGKLLNHLVVTEYNLEDELWTVATGYNLRGQAGTIVRHNRAYGEDAWAALWSNGTTWYHD